MRIIKTKHLFLIAALLLTGCLEKKTKSSNSTSSNPVSGPTNPSYPYPYPTTNPSPTPTPTYDSGTCLYGNGGEAGIADAGQTIDYYKLSLLAHGQDDGVIAWSSSSDLEQGISQNIFYSNARFNIRVVPRYHNRGNDSKGVACQYTPRPYKKLKVGVRVTNTPGGVGDYFEFTNVDVNCASQVHSFNIPTGPNPPIVEIVNVKWDWSCQSYLNQGYKESEIPGYCPWDNVWKTECYGLEIQLSTDDTKDLPGPKI